MKRFPPHVAAICVGLHLFAGGLTAQGRPTPPSASGTPLYEGAIARKSIPGDYLEINVTRGTLYLQGTASNQVTWRFGIAPDAKRAAERPRAGGTYANTPFHGSAVFKDRYQFVAGIAEPDSTTVMHAEVTATVPKDLKMVHVNVYGSGQVIVEGYDGELSVTVDSGSITGRRLSGPLQLEARNGGIDLDLSQAGAAAPRGPVNLLAHGGSITLMLGAVPSATLDLNTNCGSVEFTFAVVSGNTAPVRVTPGAKVPDADCSLRPASLPPLPGVKTLRYQASTRLGAGALSIQAMALQGDITISKRFDE